MKKVSALLCIITILSLCSMSSAEEKKDNTRYEVTISVTYNAVSPSEATRIISDAQVRHKDACSVSIKSKKVENSTAWENGTSTITSTTTLEGTYPRASWRCYDAHGDTTPCTKSYFEEAK